jgi:uncharacterized membrane protein YeaQ/YmgE (transglycosylase-associated protein family)
MTVDSTIGVAGWTIIGGLAGFFAGRVVKGRAFDPLGDIVVGLVGAILGGLVAGAYFSATFGVFGPFILAVLGAVLLLRLVRALSARRARA